ncbi:MAG TPA: hypothetical protein VK306_03740 [Acidimicrobiales bacterium]|nr:hypothetical protein [Acidimicrobiales bacterium]
MPLLSLDIRLDEDPPLSATAERDGLRVRGTLAGPDGTEVPFVGWVGLLALLQRALSTPGREVG